MKTRSNPVLPDAVDASEARCHCGQLMAILRKDGVELKCKRCKRLTLIPFSSMSVEFEPVPSDHIHPVKTRGSCLIDIHMET